MEGLLPLVYRAIRKHKTRKQYQYLSSGAAMNYNIDMREFYPQTQEYGHYLEEQKVVDDRHSENVGYMRHNSARDFSNGFYSPQQRTHLAACQTSKKIVKSRSHNMFSCFNGG
ncbi:hypothetical protein RJT34_03060 [Clitoria ternatea]|uniref:Uncharacterized protein n=1 Tax=Clitoria ternatea TaxID=43366 RepID=A0AAN9KK43_CLITE